MWKRLLGVTLLLMLASNLCWAQYRCCREALVNRGTQRQQEVSSPT